MNYKKELKKIEKNKTLQEKQNIDYINLRISKMVKLARTNKGLTQKELAEKIDTKQPSITRLESGRVSPSISFLNDIAKALGTYLVEPRFKSIEHFYINEYSNIQEKPFSTGTLVKTVLSKSKTDSIKTKFTPIQGENIHCNIS